MGETAATEPEASAPADPVARAPYGSGGMRERQRDATRAAILASALTVFSEQGFEGAKTRDIAARAGVNHAMIPYHFKSKLELWKAAVRFMFERLAREVSFDLGRIEREFGGDTRAFARAAFTEYVRYCARHPEHSRLVMQESVRDGDRLDWISRHFTRYNRKASEALHLRLIQDGVLPQVDLPSLTYIMVGASQLFYALAPEVRRVWNLEPGRDAQIEAHIDAMLKLFIR